MKIYTKSGDKGMTSLRGGEKVPKYHKRINTLGNVDELISYMGLIRSQKINEADNNILIKIQENLMTCAAIIASGTGNRETDLPELKEDDVHKLEKIIDNMEKKLPPLNSFILPGGNTLVSFCHIARTICRRAERKATELSSESSVPEIIIKYLNRLSDFLFVLARRISADLSVEEIQWKLKL